MAVNEKFWQALQLSEVGEIKTDADFLAKYSQDASLFKVSPELVIIPATVNHIKNLVKLVNQFKTLDQKLSITVRAAGTCMAGGPINDSIILDTVKLKGILDLKAGLIEVLPGTFYRDVETETLKLGEILPSYTASKELNTIGGMIGNNSGGEKNLKYGKTENYIESLNMVFADGNEYEITPLSKPDLDQKIATGDFLGQIYKNLFELITRNEEIIKQAKPDVSKNSAGYYLWNVWDGQTFDLNKLIVGAQGTLGIITKAKLKLVPVEKYSRLMVVFLPNLKELGEVIKTILKFKPDSVESYDNNTLHLALRFLPGLLKKMRFGNLFKLLLSFLPEARMVLSGGLPKLVLLVEFTGHSAEELVKQTVELETALKGFKLKVRQTKDEIEAEKYWTIRRESFSLLRSHISGKRTAPFIDDIIVRPEFLPEFLPKLQQILDRYNFLYTIAGHAGDGNFHIIPLFDMTDSKNAELIMTLSEEVYTLVLAYQGSITAEHNDGIIRTPYLEQMYGAEVYKLFEQVKQIFDPQNIFNPGKKVGGSKEYIREHLVQK